MIISIAVIVAMVMAMLMVSSFHLYNRWFGQSSGHHQGYKEKGSSSSHLDADVECAVCLSKASRGETFRVLPACHHGFHGHCIDAWLKLHSTCPLCRANVPSSQPGAKLDGLISCLLSSLTRISKWIEVSLDDEFKTALSANFGYFS